ncbi:MAG TPA: metallophosphoesterase [Candidatus Sulfotelmatobacter sp.]|jgi:Icc-related predicted phosphoesterase|nr:metallophosphoesterase [Candidatus Sulfotelmatobacter sp.]
MRIAFMSDLHLEFEPPAHPVAGWDGVERMRSQVAGHPARGPLIKDAAGVDLVVLAGDIDLGTGGIAYAEEMSRFCGCPVVYVAGNHEYYGHDLDQLRADLRAAAWNTGGRVIFLDRDGVRLLAGGHPVQVYGCSLWSDYAIHDDASEAMARARYSLNDHRRISREAGWFLPDHALDEHRQCRQWLDEQLGRREPEDSGLDWAKRLVVTHHAPIPTSMLGRPSLMAPYYMSDLRDLIVRHQPDLWLHGHTHFRHSTLVGRTVVASAPRGYLGCQPEALHYSCGIIEI